jgi:hypothetical protein
VSRARLDWDGGPGIVFDTLVSEAPTYEADVPTAPTEQGYSTDTVTARPASIRLEVMVADTDLYASPPAARPGRVQAVRDQLLGLQTNGTLTRLDTGAQVYSDMLLASVSWRRTGGSTQLFRLTFVETLLAVTATAAGAAPRVKAPVRAPELGKKKTDAPKSPPKMESDAHALLVKHSLLPGAAQ